MHHTYEPIMQRLISLQIEFNALLLAADAFKDLERPDLVMGDEEYEGLMSRIDEACKNMRMVREELGKLVWEKVELRKVGAQLAKVVLKKVGKEVGEDHEKLAKEDGETVKGERQADDGGEEDGDKEAGSGAAIGGNTARRSENSG